MKRFIKLVFLLACLGVYVEPTSNKEVDDTAEMLRWDRLGIPIHYMFIIYVSSLSDLLNFSK